VRRRSTSAAKALVLVAAGRSRTDGPIGAILEHEVAAGPKGIGENAQLVVHARDSFAAAQRPALKGPYASLLL
jgi:hypothetical protein